METTKMKHVTDTFGERIRKMTGRREKNYILLHATAVVLSGFSLYGVNPLAIAFFAAMALAGYANSATIILMGCSMAYTSSYMDAVKGIAILVCIYGIYRMLHHINNTVSKQSMIFISMASAFAVSTVDLYMEFWSQGLFQAGAGCVLAVSGGLLVYATSQAIDTMCNFRPPLKAEQNIALAILAGGVSYALLTSFHVQEWMVLAVGYALVVTILYKYGMTLGCVIGGAFGVVISYVHRDIRILGGLFVAYLLAGLAREIGRWSVMAAMSATLLITGYCAVPYFLTNASVEGILGMAIIMVMLPKEMMWQMSELENDSMETKLKKMYEERIHAIATSFDQVAKSLTKEVFEVCGDTEKEKELSPKEIYNFLRISKEEEFEIYGKLRNKRVEMKKIMGIENRRHHREYLITAKCLTHETMGTRVLANVLEEVFGKRFVPSKNSRKTVGREEQTYCFVEEANFYLMCGAAKEAKGKEGISGDNYSVQNLGEDQTVISLSDGMGCGNAACEESETVIELLEKMLDAGFEDRVALRMINATVMNRSEEERPTTLDFGIIDLHTGLCDFVKLGAAATFVKRGRWVETIQSTSMPLGVLPEVDYETVRKKLYDGDMLVMVSDGVVDAFGVEKNMEKLRDIIMNIHVDSPKEYARLIMENIKKMIPDSKERPRDDMTVLVTKICGKGVLANAC